MARQKRNFKLLLSFRQPLDFLTSSCQLTPNQLPRSPFCNRRPLRGRRILLSRFWPSSPSNFLFSRRWRPVESASSQPVLQPAPAAKGAHITVWFQGVNTCCEFFFECVSDCENRLFATSRRNLISQPPREFARVGARFAGKFFRRESTVEVLTTASESASASTRSERESSLASGRVAHDLR